jgi:hypothetical protein
MHSETAVPRETLPAATICNITEQHYMAHRMYGTFQIAGRGESADAGGTGSGARADAGIAAAHGSGRPAGATAGAAGVDKIAGAGARFALTRISPRTAVMDYGDKRTLPLAISAREIADDICREINSDAGENSFLGVFVCAGDAPTEAELKNAEEKLDAFYRALVASADREWERSHSFLFIHDLQRRAAAKLGMNKEWHYQVRETEECPGCGDRVKPGVAVCKSCHAILDRDKAMLLGLVVPVPEAAPAPGKARVGARE